MGAQPIFFAIENRLGFPTNLWYNIADFGGLVELKIKK
jgi:hypothetical protein